MTISSAELAELIRDIEAADPIDYADLPYAEDDLRQLVCCQIREIAETTESLDEEEHRTMMLAIAAKLVLENLVLHVRLLLARGQTLDATSEALFQRLRNGGA